MQKLLVLDVFKFKNGAFEATNCESEHKLYISQITALASCVTDVLTGNNRN